LVVQEIHRPPAPFLRYVDQVVGTNHPGIEYKFSQGVLTDLDVDVVHVLDANLDLLLGTSGETPLHRLLAVLALTRNLRRHRIALVRTIDETTCRVERHTLSRLACRLLDKSTSIFIAADTSLVSRGSSRARVIPHPHFRERFDGYPRGEQVRGRMLIIAPGSELSDDAISLLALPSVATVPGLTLRLAGTASGPLRKSIQSAMARSRSTLSARFERISDGASVQEFDAAELVLLPKARSSADLQTLFLALSLERPVLTPRTDLTMSIANSVGHGWLFLSEGSLTAQTIDGTFAALRESDRARQPDLTGRSLAATRDAYAALFRSAASATHPN